jgi:hypothetical protein
MFTYQFLHPLHCLPHCRTKEEALVLRQKGTKFDCFPTGGFRHCRSLSGCRRMNGNDDMRFGSLLRRGALLRSLYTDPLQPCCTSSSLTFSLNTGTCY